MTTRSHLKKAAAAGISAVALAAVPTLATSAAAVRPAGQGQAFAHEQQALETQIGNRQHQLARLTADVSGASSLTASDAAVLKGRLATESADLATLATEVPQDTTLAQLRTARAAMLRQNRVYAVMTPQVFEVIEADTASAQVNVLQAQEATLSATVTGMVGQAGYATASSHYRNFVARVQQAATATADVETTVLAQLPADFPGDTHVFVNANHRLLAAQVAIAYADYDASVIGLASGGYQGS